MLACQQVEKVYFDARRQPSTDPSAGKTDGTVKLRVYAPEESANVIPGREQESPTALTPSDMFNNAAGTVDTAKRSIVYRLREEEQPVPAAIRCFGHDKADKPNRDLIGNAVDRSMSRVEQWAQASETNKAVTVVPGGVVGITERPLDRTEAFVL